MNTSGFDPLSLVRLNVLNCFDQDFVQPFVDAFLVVVNLRHLGFQPVYRLLQFTDQNCVVNTTLDALGPVLDIDKVSCDWLSDVVGQDLVERADVSESYIFELKFQVLRILDYHLHRAFASFMVQLDRLVTHLYLCSLLRQQELKIHDGLGLGGHMRFFPH